MQPCMALVGLLLLAMANAAQSTKPLRVFLFAGQSNTQGHAAISTFDSLADDPQAALFFNEISPVEGTRRECGRVWISSIGCQNEADTELTKRAGKRTARYGAPKEEIGPRRHFGIHMQQMPDEPILSVKATGMS